MGTDGVLNQRDAWRAYDRWLGDDRVEFLAEPENLDASFRALTQDWLPTPKRWVDAYLGAFASLAGLRLVTFDRAFRDRARDVLILEG